jgi:uncharacterized protein YkwD
VRKTSRINSRKNLKRTPSPTRRRAQRTSRQSRSQKQPLSPFFFLKIAIASCLLVLLIHFGYQVLRQDDVLGVSNRFNHHRVLELINHERLRYGLSALTLNDLLDRAALLKGENMLEEQYWAHNSHSGRDPWYFINRVGYRYQSAGENLARDFGSEEEMVRAWMNSPTHRANILNPNFREMGLATLEGVLKGEEILLVVNMFGQPLRAQAVEAQVDNSEDIQQSNENTPSGESVPTNETSSTVAQTSTPPPTPVPTPTPMPSRLDQLPVPNGENYDMSGFEKIIINSAGDEAIFTSGEMLEGSESSSRMTGINLVRILFALAVFVLIIYLIYEVVFFRSRSMRQFAVKNMPHILMLLAVLFVMLITLTGFIR